MKRFVVLVVVAMMLLSGCTSLSGGDGSDGVTTTTTTDSGSGEGDGGDGSGEGDGGDGSGDGDGGDGSDGSDGSDGGDGFVPVDDFDDVQTERQMADLLDRTPATYFRPGEYLRYEGQSGVGTNFEEARPTTLTIESFEGGDQFEGDVQVTVVRGGTEQAYERGDYRGLRNLELGTLMIARVMTFGTRWTVVSAADPPRFSDLAVGDTWTQELDSGDDDSEPRGSIYTVTGTDIYAGVECTQIQVESYEGDDKRLSREYCIAPDVGPALYSIWYQDDGDVMMELELVEYRR